MCMPFLGKLFGGGHRRRSNVVPTPRPSLAPTPRQSNATLEMISTSNNLGGANNAVAPMDASQSSGSVITDLTPSMGSTIPIQAATPAATSDAVDGRPRASSWWDFLGFNRNRRGNANAPHASD
ncbi:hypothetical protein KR044_002712 [Drosophila immigrans]|nr:hypothetical protein KR044_002712 [Drosophila immigrans]